MVAAWSCVDVRLCGAVEDNSHTCPLSQALHRWHEIALVLASAKVLEEGGANDRVGQGLPQGLRCSLVELRGVFDDRGDGTDLDDHERPSELVALGRLRTAAARL